MLRLVQARSQKEMEIARSLFQEYASSLGFCLCFQNFEKELQEIESIYSPPDGGLILAFLENQPAGCVAMRKLEDGICEMKRLYVRPEFRKKGIGRALAEEIIKRARSCGYRMMRLDTVASMKEAIHLYKSLGFEEIEPYTYNPIPGALFFELKL